MSQTVTSLLKGGLGNTLFQIFCAYSYAKKYNKKHIVTTSGAIFYHNSTDYYSNNILKNIEITNTQPKGAIYTELSLNYDEITFFEGDLVLSGYFQSEQYFKEYKKEIQDLLVPENHINELREKYESLLKNKISCSIHVRRGDYVGTAHPVQNMNYYMEAIKSMPKETVFLIFSDDIAWCKSNFPDIPEKFVFIEGQKDFEDLYLMSLCNHNIIANSSFSWWGAWLNKNENQKVVAPANWFPEMKDIQCKSWILI